MFATLSMMCTTPVLLTLKLNTEGHMLANKLANLPIKEPLSLISRFC